MTRLWVQRFALAATAALAAASFAPSSIASPAPAAARSFTVVAAGGPHPFTWTWDPGELTIDGRGNVTWENPTDAVHHVTFWRGPSDKSLHLHPGGRARMKFRKAGTYDYLCDIFGHAELVDTGYGTICIGMCGTVTVQ